MGSVVESRIWDSQIRSAAREGTGCPYYLQYIPLSQQSRPLSATGATKADSKTTPPSRAERDHRDREHSPGSVTARVAHTELNS